MEQFLTGIGEAFQPATILFIVVGVVIGYVVGVIPGLSRPTALAIALPFTYSMSPIAALGLLIGITKGGATGGAISAILLNIPGEPSSAATCFDGHPMARKGQGQKALKAALYAGVCGDLVSSVGLIALAQPLALVALKLGPIELCSLMFFSLAFIGALTGESLVKGILSAAIGLLVGTIGIDIETATPRLTFGFIELWDGVPLLALGIGMLALAEMMTQIEAYLLDRRRPASFGRPLLGEDRSLGLGEFLQSRRTLARSSLVGFVIGVLPGLGATIASFMGYVLAKKASPDGHKFGTGQVEGVVAAEAADSAVSASALIPLLALGIPGSVAAAILMGAFTIQGFAPGPLLFQQNIEIVYGIYAILIIGSVSLLLIGRLGLVVFSQVTRIPQTVLCPTIVVLCVIGAYVDGSSLFAVAVMMLFGVAGYLMQKAGFSLVALLIGFILGPMVELTLRQSIILISGDYAALLSHPVALVFAAATPLIAWKLASVSKATGPRQAEKE